MSINPFMKKYHGRSALSPAFTDTERAFQRLPQKVPCSILCRGGLPLPGMWGSLQLDIPILWSVGWEWPVHSYLDNTLSAPTPS